jgi:hypothetical protein
VGHCDLARGGRASRRPAPCPGPRAGRRDTPRPGEQAVPAGGRAPSAHRGHFEPRGCRRPCARRPADHCHAHGRAARNPAGAAGALRFNVHRVALQGFREGEQPARARGRAGSHGGAGARRPAVRSELRAGGRRRSSHRAHGRGRRPVLRMRHRGSAWRRAADLFERRHHRRGGRRRREERAGDRHRDLRCPRTRAERTRRADHARTRGNDATGLRAGREARHVHGSDRRGRPHPHGDGGPVAEPADRPGTRAGRGQGGGAREARPRRRGRAVGARRARPRPRGGRRNADHRGGVRGARRSAVAIAGARPPGLAREPRREALQS